VRHLPEVRPDQRFDRLPVEAFGQTQARQEPSVGHESSILRVLPDTIE
jgi:hypothetical protein